MTLPEFETWALEKGQLPKTDGTELGECVSLVNQYCYNVLAFTAGAWGNAKDWWTNPNVLDRFDKVSTPQSGDIGVSDATSTNPDGHIWIYDNGEMLSQNWNVKLEVTLAPLPSAKYNVLGYLRFKTTQGGNMSTITSLDLARILAYNILGRGIMPGTVNAINGSNDSGLNSDFVGHPVEDVIRGMYSSPEAEAYRTWLSQSPSDAQDKLNQIKEIVG